MNFNNPSTTEELVVSILGSTSEKGEVLLKKIREVRPHFTKQALYVVLRKLVASEVVVKHGKQFSLSRPWLGKMYEFFLIAQERYGAQHETVDFLSIKDGDKIAYSFKNPEEADRFWAHAFDVLAGVISYTEPIYLYNPHEWFILARPESEISLFEKIKKQKRNLWLTAGNNTSLDKYVRQYFDGTYLQYHTLEKPLFEKNSYYLNIFGSFIIEAYINEKVAQEMDTFYKETETWDEAAKERLKTILSNGKTKLVISNNARKAKKFKRILGQNFFIAKNTP